MNTCSVCGHTRKDHIWPWGPNKGKLGDCSYADGMSYDDAWDMGYRMCLCPMFKQLTPAEMCYRLEERLRR
jgi:hypothetical protein